MLEQENNRITGQYDLLSDSVKDDDEINSKRTEMATLYKSLQARIKKVESDIIFYEEHDSCPTCAQVISSELKTTAIGKHTHKKEEISNAVDTLYNKMQDIENRANEIIETKQQIVALQTSITETNVKIIAQQKYIKALQSETKDENDSKDSLVSAKGTLKDIAKEVISFSESKSKLKEDSYYLELTFTF